MIKMDFAFSIALLISLPIVLVFVMWVFYNYRDSGISNNLNDLYQCPFCGFVFYEVNPKEIMSCPQCKSYITVSQKQG